MENGYLTAGAAKGLDKDEKKAEEEKKRYILRYGKNHG